jgi:hypothetical protein
MKYNLPAIPAKPAGPPHIEYATQLIILEICESA